MAIYNCTGSIHMESTLTEADYDVDIEWDDDDDPPTDLDVLDYLLSSGDLQIIPIRIEEVEEEDE